MATLSTSWAVRLPVFTTKSNAPRSVSSPVSVPSRPPISSIMRWRLVSAVDAATTVS